MFCILFTTLNSVRGCEDIALMRDMALENLHVKLLEISHASLRESSGYKEIYKLCSTSGFTQENLEKLKFIMHGFNDVDSFVFSNEVQRKTRIENGLIDSPELQKITEDEALGLALEDCGIKTPEVKNLFIFTLRGLDLTGKLGNLATYIFLITKVLKLGRLFSYIKSHPKMFFTLLFSGSILISLIDKEENTEVKIDEEKLKEQLIIEDLKLRIRAQSEFIESTNEGLYNLQSRIKSRQDDIELKIRYRDQFLSQKDSSDRNYLYTLNQEIMNEVVILDYQKEIAFKEVPLQIDKYKKSIEKYKKCLNETNKQICHENILKDEEKKSKE